MTCAELAALLRVRPETVRRMSQPPHGRVPRIPHLRQVRFDPARMIDVFCNDLGGNPPPPERSLTTEKRSSRGNPNGGFRKCL